MNVKRVFTIATIAATIASGGLTTVHTLHCAAQDKEAIQRQYDKAQKFVRLEMGAVRVTDVDQFVEAVKPLLPPTRDKSKPNRNDVRALAEQYDLLKRPKGNRQLQFRTGDISYWYDEGLEKWQLALEFLARQIILRVAARDNKKIRTQGDLSALATGVVADLDTAADAKWGPP